MHTLRIAALRAALIVLAAAPVAASAAGSVVTLTFSGMYELDLVLDYYSGGLSQSGSRGPSLGITFSQSATVGGDIFVGGHFSTANEPSPPVTMAFNATRGGSNAAVMNVPAGFSGGFSTYYSSPATSGTVTVYSGLDATGSVLGTLTLAQTPVDQSSVDPITHFVNTYSTWKPVGVEFSGVAHSVDFRGATDISSSVHGAAFDNITLGASTPQISSALNDPAIVFNATGTSHDSTHAALSQDGSVEVFQSQQTDLTPNAANSGGQDIYSVGANRVPVLENIDGSGAKMIGTASLPAVSPDGSAIAFLFTPAAKDKKDFVAGQMWAGGRGQPKHQVDVGMGGAGANGTAASAPSLASTAGTHLLAFCSAASNLVSNDANAGRDIFLVDPLNAASAPQRISLDGTGKELPGDSCEPRLSSDGTKLVFSVSAPPLFGTAARQIVLKDLGASKALITGQFLPITTNGSGQGASADSSEPVVSADGAVIAFTSSANLDGLGAPVGGREVFVSLRQPGGRLIKRARSADGAIPDGASQHPQLSDDGAALVMQTAATNFLGAKTLGKQAGGAVAVQCGTVAITTNLFNPASLGSSLCASGNRSNANQNPAISGDGKKVALDSNAPQPGTSSSNSNPYVQDTVAEGANVVAGLSGDYSGQWYDPNQSGQGLVIDELQPDGSNARAVLMTWFVFSNNQPTWLQGAGILKSGRGAAAGSAVVQMDQVAIYHAKSFPIGENTATPALWGSVTLTFSSANEGTMYWTSSYPGFGNGSQQIRHFLSVGIPTGPSGNAFGACYSGNWKEPSKSGHGFEFEVLPTSPPILAADWFTFAPNGAPVWLYGAGQVSGGSVQMQLVLINGSGAQFPPRFDSSRITQNLWGTATVTFSDNAHAHLSWNSVLPGYGSGQIDLQPTFGAGYLARRACQ